MLDRETADACTDALSSAIAALAETCATQAALVANKRTRGVRRAQTLGALGADIEALAGALAVIARRAEK